MSIPCSRPSLEHPYRSSLCFPISPNYEAIVIADTRAEIPFLASSFNHFRENKTDKTNLLELVGKYFDFLSKLYSDIKNLNLSIVMYDHTDSIKIGHFRNGETLNGVCLFRNKGYGLYYFLIHPCTESYTIKEFYWSKGDIIIAASVDLWNSLHILKIQSIIQSTLIESIPSTLKGSAINASHEAFHNKKPLNSRSIAIAMWVHPDTDFDTDFDTD